METDDDPVSLHDWGPFHASYMKRIGMASVLSMQASQKQKRKTTTTPALLREQHAQTGNTGRSSWEKMDQALGPRSSNLQIVSKRRSWVVYFFILGGSD